jgi:hypothetical protein
MTKIGYHSSKMRYPAHLRIHEIAHPKRIKPNKIKHLSKSKSAKRVKQLHKLGYETKVVGNLVLKRKIKGKGISIH